MVKQLNLQKFNPHEAKPFTTNILIGKRGTGKSCLLRDILYHHRKMHDVGVCCSPTMETVEMFREFVPESFIYNDYNCSVLQRIVAQQRARQEAGKDIPRIFVILDDCGYEKSMFSTKNIAMRDIFMNGRHYFITIYICLQYCVDIPPAFRANTDYVYALREPVVDNQKRLHNFFFGVVDSFQNFRKIFQAATENYECLVTANTKPSSNLQDVLFWYKADMNLPSFRLCDARYWSLHKSYYRTREEMSLLSKSNDDDSGEIGMIKKHK